MLQISGRFTYEKESPVFLKSVIPVGLSVCFTAGKLEPTKTSEGNGENVRPAHPTRRARLNQPGLGLFENPARSQVCSAALVSQRTDALTPPIPESVNQIKRHKPSTPQTCQAGIPPLRDKVLQMCSLTPQSLMSTCMHAHVTRLFIPAAPS